MLEEWHERAASMCQGAAISETQIASVKATRAQTDRSDSKKVFPRRGAM
jgi:hypothetical protein